MILGIDASTIRSGGGLSHLAGVLRGASPRDFGFEGVHVWCNPTVADYLKSFSLPDIHLWCQEELTGSLWRLARWQMRGWSKRLSQTGVNVLWSPGGLTGWIPPWIPLVALSQNLLPFEPSEMARYGLAPIRFKFLLLRQIQLGAFKKANGIMFLSKYARDQVVRCIPEIAAKAIVIPHGIDRALYRLPRKPAWNGDKPVRLLYVSTVDMYKHQWHVVTAVQKLLLQNYNVELDLVGSAYPPALRKLNKSRDSFPALAAKVHYRGPVCHAELSALYHQADIFVFASTCETISFIVLEAMAAGLPIACSNRQPMPEVLGDAGMYFDPEQPGEIAGAIKSLIDHPEQAFQLAQKAHERAIGYSWKRCADETFAFIAQTMENNYRQKEN